MAEPPREDRDRRTDEDLFEDLDQFFAPLEDDWPEGEADQPPGREVAPAPGAGAGDVAPPPRADRDEGMADTAAPAEAEAPVDADEALADLDDLAREESWIAEATAEMRPEEWGEAEEEPEAPAVVEAPEPPAFQPPEPGTPEPEGPPGGPLTPADLRTPPPAYANLPGPQDESPRQRAAAPDDEDVLAEEPTMDDLEMPLSFEDELLEEEEPPSREPDEDRVVQVTGEIPLADLPGAPEEPVEEAPGEPEQGDVEAAAEHFAAGLRPDDVERDLLSDLEGTTHTAPIDREAVLDQAAAGEPGTVEEPEPGAAEEPEPAGVVADEGEAPPSWEDGGAVAATEAARPEAEAPAEAAPGEQRNLVAAFVSGVVLVAAAIGLLIIGNGAFAFLAGAVIVLSQGELYAVMRKKGYEPATLLGLAMGLLLVIASFVKGPLASLFVVSLSMLVVVLWYMAAPPAARRGSLRDAGATLFGIVYVPFLASFAMLLLAGQPSDLGRNLFLVVVGLTVLYDICAYAIGSLWGSRPLAATISPRKSWEGAIGATFVLLLAALAIVPSIDPFEAGNAVGLALVIAVAAPLGDLVESAIKRDLGVKDMSTLLPGHGGMLDRIDAILFAAPAAYWYLLIVLPS